MSTVPSKAAGKSISLRGLTKRYGDTIALSDLNLEIQEGEFVTFLGPSGSGKTTTLLMIAGFVFPDSGEILIGGHSVITTPTFRRNLGMVFQSYTLFPNMNVFRNIAFPLEMRGVRHSEIHARVSSALEMVQLPGHERRRVNQLSGGQQQRVALARALVYEPSVLLLDEPLGALDLKLRQEMQLEILRLYRRLGITIVFVTHDQGEALTMSGRIVVMDKGVIQQVGTPHEIYRNPNNAFVADFIGDSNFISGKVGSRAGRLLLQTEDGLELLGVGLGQGLKTAVLGTVVVRPECIVPVHAGDRPDNVLEGEVVEVIFLGEFVQYRVSVGPRTTITAKWVMKASTKILKPGDRAQIGWSADDMVQV